MKQLRLALNLEAQTLSEIPPFDVATAGKLYDALLKPGEPGRKCAASLLMCPTTRSSSCRLACS